MNIMHNKVGFIAVVPLMLVTLSAQASHWASVADSREEAVYYDEQQVHRDGQTVTAWVLHSYPHTKYLGDYVYAHRSSVIQYQFKCDVGELGYTRWSFFSAEIGSGNVVWSDDAQNGVSFYKPDSTSIDKSLMEKIC
jgi:hypothetical protein